MGPYGGGGGGSSSWIALGGYPLESVVRDPKNDGKIKVLRMGFSIVESLSVSGDIILNLFRGPQLNFGEKSKNM